MSKPRRRTPELAWRTVGKQLNARLISATLWAGTIIIDALMLVVYVPIQYIAGKVIELLPASSSLDQSELHWIRIVIFCTTLLVTLIYSFQDIRELWSRGEARVVLRERHNEP